MIFVILFTISCEKDPEETAREGIVAHYTFDEEDVIDLSGNEYNGYTVNSPAYISDTPNGSGKALYLNAVKKQYMVIPYNPIKETDAFTIAFWIKDFSAGQIMSVVGSQTYYSYPFLEVSGNRFYSSLTSTQSMYDFDVNSIQDEAWHHLAYTYAERIQALYIDGKKVGTVSNTSYSNYSSPEIMFAGDSGFSERVAMSIKFDNIRIYDRCLNDKEVAAIYEGEKQ